MARMVYELDDEVVNAIRAAGIELPAPHCEEFEHLIVNAQAFRDFHDGAEERDAELIASAPDDIIEEYVDLTAGYGERIYNSWADLCDDTLMMLHARKAERPGDFNRTEKT